MHLSNMTEDVLYCKKGYWIKVSSFVLENANVHKIKCKILKDKIRVTAKWKLERRQFSTSSSFVKI